MMKLIHQRSAVGPQLRLAAEVVRRLFLPASRHKSLNAAVLRGVRDADIARPAWTALVQGLSRVDADPTLGPAFRAGDASWFSARFGLRDLAIAAGHEAHEADDRTAVAQLSAWMERAGAKGPKALHFIALARNTEEDRYRLNTANPRHSSINGAVLKAVKRMEIDRPAWNSLAAGLHRIETDPVLKRAFLGGEASWFSARFELNDLALTAGYEALEADDRATASVLCDWIERSGAKGPKARRFMAMTYATNEEWGLAAECWSPSSRNAREPDAQAWEQIERRFAEMRRILEAMDVDWLDLRPIRPVAHRQAVVDDFIRASLARPEVESCRLRALILVRSAIGVSAAPSMPAETAATVRSISSRGLRNFVDGKTVCLVANSNTVAKSGLGALIDSYDVVIRFNSFVIDPLNTGNKTTIHVCIHLYEYNLEIPVDIRIMISGREDLWLQSLTKKIVPGAQKMLGDRSLRWPAVQAGLITKTDPFRTPTAGFNMLALLLNYGVCTKLDLIGFDFYSTGSFRIPDALRIAHSPAHNSAAERAWIMSRAKNIDGPVISMSRLG